MVLSTSFLNMLLGLTTSFSKKTDQKSTKSEYLQVQGAFYFNFRKFPKENFANSMIF